MTQRWIDLRFAAGGIEQIIVANAFLLAELHLQQKEWRMNALIRLFLEVVPAQKTKHQSKLRKPILGAVTARFANDFIENTGNVWSVLEAQIFPQRHGGAFYHRRCQCGMPNEELLELDIAVVEQDWHGRDR